MSSGASRNLKEVYQDYELYLSGSTSEGFGLTLMEAIGGGLPIIGFDVRYGNPTFIDDGGNGYLIPIDEHMTSRQKIEALTDQADPPVYGSGSGQFPISIRMKRAGDFLQRRWS